MSEDVKGITGLDEQPMVLAENLVKIYKTADIEVLALQGLDLTVQKGELTAIIGNSGSGKSTFLNMLGGLDEPSAGRLYVDGQDLFKMTRAQKDEYKRNTVGFVWQNNARNLLPYMTALENIITPMLLTSAVQEMLQWLHNNGSGSDDHSAILKYYEHITGTRVRG